MGGNAKVGGVEDVGAVFDGVPKRLVEDDGVAPSKLLGFVGLV